MADYIEIDFANRCASRLERFQIISTNPLKVNFRCPFCMDSKKSKTKARGWLLETDENKVRYYCHNCFESHNFKNFLKHLDPMLHSDYVAERFMQYGGETTNRKFESSNNVSTGSGKSKVLFVKGLDMSSQVEDEPVDKIEDTNLKSLQKISDLDRSHPARQYIASRMMPTERFSNLYYVPKFKRWVNSIVKDKFPPKSLERDEPRIILPFCDVSGKMFGFTGRSFDPKAELRYITIMIDTTKDKFFGLDRVNFKETYYVFEGGIDSMFFDNACAMAGADAHLDQLKNKENCVVVYDNEPRNPQIHKKIESALDNGFKVVIWPDNIFEKDVNNMILYENYDPNELLSIMEKNTKFGLMGKLRLSEWVKADDDRVEKKKKKTAPDIFTFGKK